MSKRVSGDRPRLAVVLRFQLQKCDVDRAYDNAQVCKPVFPASRQ